MDEVLDHVRSIWRTFASEWNTVRQHWTDGVMQQFEADFWNALEQHVREYESEIESLQPTVRDALSLSQLR